MSPRDTGQEIDPQITQITQMICRMGDLVQFGYAKENPDLVCPFRAAISLCNR
jgi:hypothetical protein